jgi:hypothetical protein
MTGLRSQQERWIKGGAQNARLHLITILRSRIPRGIRGHAVQHLVAGSTYVVILAMLILSVPLAATKNTAITFDYQDFGLPFVLATAALGWTFYVARAPRQSRNFLQFVALLAGFMIFTMGLSVHNGIAAIAGWFGRSGGDFVRTPKAGSTPWNHSAYAGQRINRRVLSELGMIIWLTLGLAVAVVRREPALVPLQLVGLAGTAWVAGLSLWHPLRARAAAGGPAVAGPHSPYVTHPTEELTS